MSNMWISVDDKFKPQIGKEYLVKTSEGYTVAYRDKCGWETTYAVGSYDEVHLTGNVLEWFNKDLEEIQ